MYVCICVYIYIYIYVYTHAYIWARRTRPCRRDDNYSNTNNDTTSHHMKVVISIMITQNRSMLNNIEIRPSGNMCIA